MRLTQLTFFTAMVLFSADNFKVGCDWARVAFNPTCQRLAAGAADGSVYIWNVNGPLETVLKDPK